jgi:hypothetical protein
MISMINLIKNHCDQKILSIKAQDKSANIFTLISIYDILFANIEKSDEEDE